MAKQHDQLAPAEQETIVADSNTDMLKTVDNDLIAFRKMTDTRLTLTDKSVAKLPYAKTGQYLARDTELPGFFVLVGKRRKTFAIQADLKRLGRRRTLRLSVGRVGETGTREARAKAKEYLGRIARGDHPEEASRNCSGPTLAEAWARYRESHLIRKGRSEGTIANARDHVERVLADWRDTPLAELGKDPRLVTDRHDQITHENGPYIANGAMRTLRAIYNHARRTCRDLPAENPVTAIDWNVETRRDTGMGSEDLVQWFAQLRSIQHPIRREFHMMCILSGSRPGSLKVARWDHLDIRRRVLHVPKPKGGARKAFDIPLSREMLRSIWRARKYGAILHAEKSKEWIFPADSASGHLEEHKEDRSTLSKWGNELRQTYRTLAQEAGLSDLDAHLLMNHSLPGVNAGYLTRGKLTNHLREQQQRLSTFILAQSEAVAKADQALPKTDAT